MRRIFGFLLMLTAVGASTGCNSKTDKVGGPGASNPGNRDKITPSTPERAFTLDVPNLGTDVKQGESKVIAIAIKRGTNFDQDVTLSFDGVPKGVSIEPARPVVKHGEKEVKLTVTAAADAALGTHMIKVSGNPASGPPATNEFKVTVKEK